MPKVRAPLFSATASGTLAKTLTFLQHANRTIVRFWTRPTDPKTPHQQAERDRLVAIAQAWNALSPADRAIWKTAGMPRNLSGWSLWWQQYAIQGIDPPATPEIPQP